MKTPEWMRFTPGSMQNMRCSKCSIEYAVWLGCFTMFIATARAFLRMWHGLAIATVVLTLAWLIPELIW